MRLSLGTRFILLLTGAALHIGSAKAGFDDLPAVQEEQDKIASKAYKDQIFGDVGSIMGDPETRQNFQHFIGILEANPAATAALAEGTIRPLLQTLEEELEWTVQEVNALTGQRDAAQQSADENRARAERFYTELQHLRAAHPNAQHLADLEQERDAATERARVAQTTQQDTEAQLRDLQRQIREAEAARDAAAERADHAQTTQRDIEQATHQLHQDLLAAHQDLLAAHQAQQRAEQVALNTEAQLQPLREDVARLNEELRAAQEAQRQAEEQLPDLQRQVQEVEAARVAATERADRAQATQQDTEQVINNTRAQLETRGKVALSLEKALNEAKNQAQTPQQQLDATGHGDYLTASVAVGGTDAILSRNIETFKKALLAQQNKFVTDCVKALESSGGDKAKIWATRKVLHDHLSGHLTLLGQTPTDVADFTSETGRIEQKHLTAGIQAIPEDLTQIPLPSLYDMVTQPTTQNP